MKLSKILKKIKAAILCCREEDSDQVYLSSPANYTRLASTSSGASSNYHSAATHLTPRASATSHRTHKSSAASPDSGSSIYYTASEERGPRQGVSRQSSGGRSSEQYSLGNISPKSLSRVSSTTSAARQSQGIFGNTPKKLGVQLY
jgi:hypothetical protein